jgi:hypothetical protein
LGQKVVASRLGDLCAFPQHRDAVEAITAHVFPSGFFDEVIVYETSSSITVVPISYA